jgi:hypothetical protein
MVDKIFDKTNLDKKEEEPKGMFDDVELSESEKIPENATADEILKEMQAEVDKKAKQKKQKRLDEYKSVAATKSLLFSRTGKLIDVPILINDDEIMIFKIKRLSEADNSDIIDRSLAVKNLDDMTPEELEESNEYNYRLLEKAVVEPKMTANDWKHVDTALMRELVSKITDVLGNVDDTALFEDFRKK